MSMIRAGQVCDANGNQRTNVKACVPNIVMADSVHDIPLHLYYRVYIKHTSEGIFKYLYTFLDQFPTSGKSEKYLKFKINLSQISAN
jgi:hypothetical protein